MARLVAATCPRCGGHVKLDPDKEYITCTFCGTSSFVETPKRKATQEMAQAHYPVIQVQTPRIVGCLPAVIGVVVAVVAAGGAATSAFMHVASVPSININIPNINIPNIPKIPNGQTPGVEVPAAVNLFQNPAPFKAKLVERFGSPVMATEVVLYEGYAFIEAQDPKNKTHLDRYNYRDGEFGEGDPVRLGSDKDRLDKMVFSVDSLNFGLVPTLMATALASIKVEEGKVSHIIISRDSFGRGAPTFRVYVNGPRDSGYVLFAADGKLKRVYN